MLPIASSTCRKASSGFPLHAGWRHSCLTWPTRPRASVPPPGFCTHRIPCLLHSALGSPPHSCARPVLSNPSSLLSLTLRRRLRKKPLPPLSQVLPKVTQPGRSTSRSGCRAGSPGQCQGQCPGQKACSQVSRSHLQAGGELPEGRVHTRSSSLPFTEPST